MDKILQKFEALLSSTSSEITTTKKGQQEKYPQLRRKLVKRMGFYCYEERKEVNLKNHVNLMDEDPQGIFQSKLFPLLQGDFKLGAFKGLCNKIE
jgi:hypothetical protein